MTYVSDDPANQAQVAAQSRPNQIAGEIHSEYEQIKRT
jgi:hypothetical protein